MNKYVLNRRLVKLRYFIVLVILYLMTIILIKVIHEESLETGIDSEIPIIFVITPTYTRPAQMPDLTRMGQTLMHIKHLFWIVIEDSNFKSIAVSELLERINIPNVHLLGARPLEYDNVWKYGRGVSNRFKALEWLRNEYINSSAKGVIYFADDDNTYDIRLFEEIRFTKKVSMFPVGLIPTLGLSSPILDNNTAKIIGFHDPDIGGKKFAVDMAGFAVNLRLFLSKPNATLIYIAGQIENHFLKSLDVNLNEIEPLASNCSVIMVWHTKTSYGSFPSHNSMEKVKNYNATNLPLLYFNLNKTFQT